MAVQEGNSDVVEVRLAGSPQALEVLLNQKALSFTEQNWMDLKGEWPSTMQGLPKVVILSLVLPQEVVDSGAQIQKPWRSQDTHGHRLGILALPVTLLGQREQLLSQRSVLIPPCSRECLSKL